MTWNVRGVMSSALLLSQLMTNLCIDFVFITEHYLLPHSLGFLNSIDPNYTHVATCDKSTDMYSWLKCGKGGTAILFKKQWQRHVSCIETNSDRIIGIEFKYDKIILIYMCSI